MKLFIFTWLVLLPCNSFAATWEASLAPTLWQYQEISPQRNGIGSTPFQSNVQGMALEAAIQNTMIWHTWSFSSRWQGLQSLQSSQEKWSFRQSTQNNQLSIQQSELKFDISHPWQHIQWGLGTSYQWHQQSRQNFRVNGVPVSVAGEPIIETVQTLWLDSHIMIPWQAWRMCLSIGVPTWVHTTNTLLATAFTSKQGFRTHMTWSYQPQQSPWKLQASYNYRELGNQITSNGWLWPKNRWQTASIGVSCGW
ncbi:MAG: hypothetical protein Q9M15_06925 [Mariprofundaceae bacterium]|nr:hypothetical protein [Mariprofundaceae bacterium]